MKKLATIALCASLMINTTTQTMDIINTTTCMNTFLQYSQQLAQECGIYSQQCAQECGISCLNCVVKYPATATEGCCALLLSVGWTQATIETGNVFNPSLPTRSFLTQLPQELQVKLGIIQPSTPNTHQQTCSNASVQKPAFGMKLRSASKNNPDLSV